MPPHLFTLQDEIVIHAPAERCFQLSTHLAIVQDELGMRPVQKAGQGRIQGSDTGGDTVRWKGWKFGLPQFHESLIEAFDPPRFFRDRMLAGRFRTFEHDHRFEDLGNSQTRLSDELRFTMPLGPLGAIAGRIMLVPHIRGLMSRRFHRLKRIAESDEWRKYLSSESPSGLPAVQAEKITGS